MSTRDVDRSPQAPPTGFEIVTVPIGDYAKLSSLRADDEADEILALLEPLGGVKTEPQTSAGPWNRDRAISHLSHWADYTAPSNRLLYWAGHGEANQDGAWLAVHDTHRPMRGSGLGPDTFADHVVNQWERRLHDDTWAMVIVEACGAERFINLLSAHLSKVFGAPKRLILFAAGGQGESYLGTFRVALQKALASYTDNDTEIRLLDLIHRVRGYCSQAYCVPLDVFPEPSFQRQAVLRGGITATVDVYEELQRFLSRLPADERSHFVPKAQGAEQGELAWYFTGRKQERARICEWLRTETSGLLVVTGRAGSGKSALLGNVLVYSNPELRGLLVRHRLIDDLPPGELPPDNAFTEVVHLTGMTTAELVKRLLQSSGTEFGATLNESLEALIVWLQQREQPFTLLADALDESQEPTSIAASVLQRIAAQPRCRVIVGTRQSTREGPDQPDTRDDNLLSALGLGKSEQASARVLWVERDEGAMREYVLRRLAVVDASTTADLSLADIADKVCSRPTRQFLYARLSVHEILAEPDLLLSRHRARLDAVLEYDHRQLFAKAVVRLKKLASVNEALIVALAFAGGRGLPRTDGIWAISAQAVADAHTEPVADAAIDDLLRAAAPYIILDGENGQSVYRLAHRTFQEHFGAGSTRTATQSDYRRRHAQIADALIVAAPFGQELNPYLRLHLANHVGISGSWFALNRRSDLLDRLDPGAITTAVLTHAFGHPDVADRRHLSRIESQQHVSELVAYVPSEIAALASIRHLLEGLRPEERALTRALALARVTQTRTAPDDATATVGNVPRLAWAKLAPIHPHIVLADHLGPVSATVALTLRDGRCLLASSGINATRIWDPNTGAMVGEPLIGSMYSLAEIRLQNGQCLLASGGIDNFISLHDPVTGRTAGILFGHTDAVTSLVAVELPDGRTWLASGSRDTTVRLWDPVAQRQIGEPLKGHTGVITSLAALTLSDGRCIVASGSRDDRILLWDPVAGCQTRSLVACYEHGVAALVVFTKKGGRKLLVSSGGGPVRFWDPDTGMLVRKFTDIRYLTPLAVATLADGRCMLALRGEGNVIELCDAVTGKLADVVLAGHTSSVNALAVLSLTGGRILLASGGEDGTVRLWDPAIASHAIRSRPYEEPPSVLSLATFKAADSRYRLAVSELFNSITVRDPASGVETAKPFRGAIYSGLSKISVLALPEENRHFLADGAGRLWDPVTGKLTGAPFVKDSQSITALAAVVLHDGQSLIAYGQSNGTIALWNPFVGRVAHVLFDGRTSSITSLCVFELADGQPVLAAGSLDGAVRLWDPARGEAMGSPLVGHRSAVSSMAAFKRRDGMRLLVSGSWDRTVRLWDPQPGGSCGESLFCSMTDIASLLVFALKDETCLLASAEHDGTMRLWDVAGRNQLAVWRISFAPHALAWANGKLIVGGRDGIVAFELEPPDEAEPSPARRGFWQRLFRR